MCFACDFVFLYNLFSAEEHEVQNERSATSTKKENVQKEHSVKELKLLEKLEERGFNCKFF